MNKHRKIRASGAFGVILALTQSLQASGIEQAFQDVSSFARGNAVVATVDGASAVHYNPAGLNGLKGPTVQWMSFYANTRIRNENALGFEEKSRQEAFTGSLFFGTPIGDDSKWSVGLGMTIPHGLGISWDSDGPLRSLAIEGELLHLVTTASVAYQASENLFLGAGIQFAYDQIDVTQGLIADPDFLKYEADGNAWGFNLGLQWNFHEDWDLGLTYRSAMKTDFSGDLRTRFVIPALMENSESADATFQYPQQVIAGLAFRPNSRWEIEINMQWTNWESLDEFRISPAGASDLVSPYSYDDTILASVGATYALNDQWNLNCGYLFSTAAAPDETYSPFVPDSELHVLTLGFDYKVEDWTLSLAGSFGYRHTRDVSESPSGTFVPVSADGRWRTAGLSVAAGGSYTF